MDLSQRLKAAFSIDLRSIALFRITLGLVLLTDLLIRSFDLIDFYTDAGVLTRSNWLKATNELHWSLHAASGQWWFQGILFILAAVVCCCLIIGYRTRLMAVLCWILTVSIINRNVFILQGGDELIAVLTFWAMFLPLNARFSVDAALSTSRHNDANSAPAWQHQGSRQADYQPAPLNGSLFWSRARWLSSVDTNNQYFSVATVAVILQVLYLYFFTAFLKTGDAWRVDMTGAFYAVSLQHFATPIGAWIREFPAFLTFGTWYVMVVEFAAPVIALSPWFHLPLRIIALLCLYSLHVSFILMLHIGIFPLVDFAALTLLIPGVVWAWLANTRKRQTRAETQLFFDQGCEFCKKTCLVLREFLLPSASRILPAQQFPDQYQIMQEHDSWVVVGPDGKSHTRWAALQFLLSQSPIFKPLGWLMKLPGLMNQGDRLYGWIGRNRQRMGLVTERFLPYTNIRLKPTVLAQAAAAFFLYVITFVNIAGLSTVDLKVPRHVDVAKRITRLDQKWNMFAPFPLTYSLYPVIVGKLRDGSTVDLNNINPKSTPGSRDWRKPDWTVPDYIYPVYEGYRWRKFLGRVNSYKSDLIRRGYGSYLCRSWNHPGRKKELELATADINFIKLTTNTSGQPKERAQRRAWQHWCFEEFAPKK